MSRPSVSVVVPVHNGARFLASALRSALAQDRPADEVVVVDDGSTDGTAAVLDTFGDAVRVIRQPHSGVAVARNTGIEAATGDYLALLDADDLWLPAKLAAQVDAAEAGGGAALVCCGYVVVDETLRPLYEVPGAAMQARVGRAVTLDDWGLAFSITALVARDVVDAVGGFDPEMSTSADLEFAVKVAARHPVTSVARPLALYRTHAGQMHHDVDQFERDMTRLYDRLFSGDVPSGGFLDEDRARANLHTRLAFRRAAAGDWRAAADHARRAARRRPSRLVAAPLQAAAKRVGYAVRALRHRGARGAWRRAFGGEDVSSSTPT